MGQQPSKQAIKLEEEEARMQELRSELHESQLVCDAWGDAAAQSFWAGAEADFALHLEQWSASIEHHKRLEAEKVAAQQRLGEWGCL